MIDVSGWRKRQIALDVKADNARELGLDYEPDKTIIEMAIQGHSSTREAIWWAIAFEREACAKVCDDSVEYAGSELARQIRARSQTTCVHEWVDDTKLKPQWRCIKCGAEYTKEKA